LLHLVGSSVLLYLIDDAQSNKNQVYALPVMFKITQVRNCITCNCV